MLKKLLKVVATLTLLAGCYLGYARLFAMMVDELRASRRTGNTPIVSRPSNSKKQAIAIAKQSFGQSHWSANDDLDYRYYNAERGFWMYARKYERIVEENGVRYDGKRVKLTPFALISTSHDGKSVKTVTSDLAILDLSEPLGFNVNPNGEPLKLKHARLEGNVFVRDNKSTPDPADDMRIGPITTAEYDEPSQQIHTEAYVIIQDLQMVATSDGMLIQLRKDDGTRPANGSAGFDGVERLDLLKNVHVLLRDVGKSGIVPGPASSRGGAPAPAKAPEQTATTGTASTAKPPESAPPTPLDIRSDSKMQVLLPKPRLPVAVGPPEPPAATIVQFERNVVVLRGEIDDQPDELTSDMLKLSLVPGEKPADGSAASEGLFGGLTLQRAYAVGHVVWVHLPKQGTKIRCNELIHSKQAPKPDVTYLSGNATRPVEIDKVDITYDEDDELDPGTVTSVTHIWTADATILDKGTGFDTANVVARGPGRLETRADRDQPVEKIAIWQKKFILVNEVSSEGVLLHKVIDLTGNRPCFIDKLQDTQLDSAELIKVTLKPKPVLSTATVASATTARSGSDPADGAPIGTQPTASQLVETRQQAVTDLRPDGNAAPASAATQGGSKLQIEKLLAIRDVHLLAPNKTMNASQQLYAEFFDADALPPSTTTSKPVVTKQSTAAKTDPTPNTEQQEPDANPDQGADQKAAEPPMTATAERIWAKVMLRPKPGQESTSDTPATKPNNVATTVTKADPAGGSTPKRKGAAGLPGSGDTDAEIRLAWLLGNAALHQEPGEGNTKGQDASGEAMYIDNRGSGKAIMYVYQRDPTETTCLPGPVPPAVVDNGDDNLQITVAGILKVNQETDQAWAEGPGTLTQLVDRGFLSDKSGEEADDDAQDDDDAASKQQMPEKTSGTDEAQPRPKARSGSKAAAAGVEGGEAEDAAPGQPSKPKTRAGRPLPVKEPMTIGFTEGMDFTGRATDPEGRPAAEAIFGGFVTARMEDALLHGEKKMIAYTDRIVPLAQLGTLTQGKPKSNKPAEADGDSEAEPKPQITLIYSYRNAVAINRKVDPDSPRVLQQQRIEADYVLAYDRRTGDFFIPGKGVVYLYDQDKDSAKEPEEPADSGLVGNDKREENSGRRVLTPTSARAPANGDDPDFRGDADTARPDSAARTRSTARPTEKPTLHDPVPQLVLTQIHFSKGMRGRFGTGNGNDQNETRWAEFFGDIETAHAKVANTYATLNHDKLPADGFFLAGQTMRVITEPPPVGSPAGTPARNYVKAWENAFVRSTEWRIGADLVTYDSYKDLVYAYGENGHNVIYAQQHAAGQPTSPGSAKAVQLNPKTGALHLIESDTVQVIDKKTGIHLSPALAPDPFAKAKKKVKRPYKLPYANLERRGFTGQ